MAQFMRQHRTEQRENIDRGSQPGLLSAHADKDQKDQQQQESEVQPDGNAEQAQETYRSRYGLVLPNRSGIRRLVWHLSVAAFRR